MAPKNDFPDFNGFINKGRERRKDELLANKFLGANRRASAPGATNNRKPGSGPSLASRMGVGKRGAAVTRPVPKQNPQPVVGNVDAEWTHDLHSLNNPGASRTSQIPPRGPRNVNTRTRNDRLAKVFNGSASTPNLNAQYNIVGKTKAVTGSLSIKGLAGPYIVMAENFARGTSAQDIESAMSSVGGVPLSCRLISTHPKVVAEIIFDSKDGADNVIDTFNNQEADGNLLYVYHKSGALAQTPLNQRPLRARVFPQVRRLVALNAAQGMIVLILGIITREVPEKMLLMVLTDLTIVWTLMIMMMVEVTAMVEVKVFIAIT
ncbi:hypothetical protein DID88_003634 [Monilinia fructigena]|uniref:RRM domain-containing protein n=1 Tax=Monilinia fructigena TaxID=38457 RepID=A0A395ITF5_9HELO|nr:hypothetical protein DID88_003634 [Monilinia fructigena]